MANKTIGGCVRTPCPDAFLQALLVVSVQGAKVANSRPEPESIYPGSTGVVPRAYNARPHEPRTPMPRAPREESSDSTHFSAKRQRDRKSQLSSSMRARLGPQEPGRSRPPVATTRAPRPDPVIAHMVQNVPPHRDPWSPQRCGTFTHT
ncbi:hypothetical protein CK203_018842 [Vitis vinifera]|uniref:Uncharacterized protein n=1 Tax=Vitis vinifera TaxID=29760 RepID=A0A438JB54_VITVI|nr:hypothetical protein CK203_018842 [Vitis vinifera]